MALGEQVLLETCRALRDGPAWDSMLLIITYDEHGGCYYHVPHRGAPRPRMMLSASSASTQVRGAGAHHPGQPVIPARSVLRVPDGATPFDHTSILATVEHRSNIPALIRRDAAGPDVAAALT